MSLTKPDKGWAWAVMIASFCIISIHGFLVYGYGMVHVALLEHFHEGNAKTSIVGSLLTGFLSCAGVLDGLLIRHSSCRLVAISGGIVMTAGIFISAFMKSLNWILFTYGVVAGVGAGIQYTAIIIAIGYNFERNVNLALGFALSGVGIGTLVFTPVFTYIKNVYSLEGVFICMAGLSLQSVIFSSMLFPSNLEINYKQKSSGKQDSVCLNILNLFKTKPFFVLLMSLFIASFGTYIVYIHFAEYAIHQGTSELNTSFLLSIIGSCSCVSRILAGLACNSKVIDEPTLLSGTLAITGVFTVTLPLYGHTYTGQNVFAIALGLYAGCAPAIMNGITLRYLSISYLSTAVGVELAFMGCGVMTGPPAIGLIIDATGKYNISFIIAGLCILGGSILTIIAELCNTTKQNYTEN